MRNFFLAYGFESGSLEVSCAEANMASQWLCDLVRYGLLCSMPGETERLKLEKSIVIANQSLGGCSDELEIVIRSKLLLIERCTLYQARKHSEAVSNEDHRKLLSRRPKYMTFTYQECPPSLGL